MLYTHDQFYRLIELVESEGGYLLDEPHEPGSTFFEGDNAASGEARLSGCGEDTLFAVPYINRYQEPDSAVLCASCDMMGLMPRFAKVME